MTRRAPLHPAVVGSAIRTGDARLLGMGRSRLRAADIDHPFFGISSSGLDIAKVADACTMALPLLRPGEAFSHLTAAALFGIPLPGAHPVIPLHVVTSGARAHRNRKIIGHSTGAPVAIRRVAGLPVTTPADTWCLIAGILAKEDLVAAGDHLLSRRIVEGRRIQPWCTADELQGAVDRHGSRRGAAKLAWAIGRVREGVDSRPESLLRLLLVGARLPEPTVAHAIRLADGSVAHADLAYPEWQTALEYEGKQHLTDEVQWRRDIARYRAMEEVGWLVVRVTSDELFRNPRAFIAYLRRTLRARRLRIAAIGGSQAR